MAQLTKLNDISIAQICVYTPALLVAILLASRHGFGRNAGWLFLILFSLIRILGAALELATINDPTNLNLIVASSTLQNVGLSPLILVMLGLVGRVLASISNNRVPFLQPRVLRLVQVLVLVGLILGIVGGSELSGIIAKSISQGGAPTSYTVPTESQAGLGLMIAGYGLLVIATLTLATEIRSADDGDKRLLGAVALALPFVLVRLIFSAIGTFNPSNPNFGQFNSGPDYPSYLIGMSVVMEMVAIIIFEAVGLTLRQVPKTDRRPTGAVPMTRFRGRNQQQAKYDQEQGVSQA